MPLRNFWNPDDIGAATKSRAIGNGHVRWTARTLLQTGKITEIKAFQFDSGTLRYGLWGPWSGSYPVDALLTENTGVACVTGENTIQLPTPVDATSGNGLIAGATSLDSAFITQYYTASGITSWQSYQGNTTLNDPLSSYQNEYADQSMAMSLWGWVPPVISSIDGDNTITTSQTGVVVSANDLMTSGATIELCNNADYASATIKVTQTYNSQTDTTLNFDVVQGALSTGTVYAFVTTSLGQRNTTGFAVTLEGGVSVPEITGELSVTSQTIAGEIILTPTVSGELNVTSQNVNGFVYSVPVVDGSTEISQQNIDGSVLSVPVVDGDINISGQSVNGAAVSVPSINGDIDISLQNVSGEIISVPVFSGEISLSSQNISGVLTSFPIIGGDILVSAQNIRGTIDAVSAIPIISGLLNISSQSSDGQFNSVNILSGEMEITGQNSDGSLTSVVTIEGSVYISGNQVSGTFEALVVIPSLSGEMVVSGQSLDGNCVSVPMVSGEMELSDYEINGLFVSPGRIVYSLKIVDDDRTFKIEG